MADPITGTTFQIPQADVKAALDHLRLETNALSPLAILLKGQTSPILESPDLATQINQPTLRQTLIQQLEQLGKYDTKELLARRYERLMSYGVA